MLIHCNKQNNHDVDNDISNFIIDSIIDKDLNNIEYYIKKLKKLKIVDIKKYIEMAFKNSVKYENSNNIILYLIKTLTHIDNIIEYIEKLSYLLEYEKICYISTKNPSINIRFNALLMWCVSEPCKYQPKTYYDSNIKMTIQSKTIIKIFKYISTLNICSLSFNNNYLIKMASKNNIIHIVKYLLLDSEVDPTADNNYAVRFAQFYNCTESLELLLLDKRIDSLITIPKL